MSLSLAEQYPEANWFFFANEETQVDLQSLGAVLDHYNENEASVIYTDYRYTHLETWRS